MASGSLSPPSLSRRALLGWTGAAAVGGLGLSGCGVDRMLRGREDGLVTWGSWANPGEAKRFYEFNDRYTEQTGVLGRGGGRGRSNRRAVRDRTPTRPG